MTRIIHNKWFHYAIRILRLQRILKRVLSFLSPTFKHDGIVYRIKSPESFLIAREIFKQGTYDLLLNQTKIHTVIDLGCNTGFFTCLLSGRYGGKNIKGVLVDADADVLKECEWHLQANHIDNCKTICAIIGATNSQTSDFFISEFNISSSTRPFDENYPFPLRTIKKVKRPVVTLKKLITTIFASERVNILKIDIEGSEMELLAQDLSCLNQVDWIVLEWHKWVISLEEVINGLSKYNFTLIDILKEDSICGLVLLQNDNSPNRALKPVVADM